jgi:SAM-dependent methyltransferase
MRIGNRVRRIYERRPYPPPSLRGAGASWKLLPIEWINAVTERTTPFAPARILVAGCGVGAEAFAFARQFPAAEVVGVDFSPRSIAIANRLRRTAKGGQRVRFEVADIASRGLVRIAGDHFDLVSCHGVLSYVPEPGSVLRNFVRCLTSAGVVMLGVNGASHPSVRWRPVFPRFGIDADEFRESGRVREVLRVCESLSGHPSISMAERDAGYLAGDLFGPLNRTLSLAEWNRFCRQAGLHLLGSYQAQFAIRDLLNRDLHCAVMPRSRAEVAELVDALQPASFHQLVLSPRAPIKTPWTEGNRLLRRRPFLTSLYRFRWPGRSAPWHKMRNLTLESRPINTKVNLRVPQWEVEILRSSNGERSLGEILDPVRPSVSAKSLREAMYLLYQLGVVNLLREKR